MGTVQLAASATVVLITGLVLGGCERRQAKATASGLDSAVVDTTYLDPNGGCNFVRAQAHPEALALAREFVQRDAKGEFLFSNRWLDTAYTCPGRLPAPDAFTVISRYAISPLALGEREARVVVKYTVVGTAAQTADGMALDLVSAGAQQDTFVLVHTGYGWRIGSPLMPEMVHARAALRAFGSKFSETDRGRLADDALHR